MEFTASVFFTEAMLGLNLKRILVLNFLFLFYNLYFQSPPFFNSMVSDYAFLFKLNPHITLLSVITETLHLSGDCV